MNFNVSSTKVLLVSDSRKKQGYVAFQICWRTTADLPVQMNLIKELNPLDQTRHVCTVQRQSSEFHMPTPTVRACYSLGLSRLAG